MNLSKSLNLIGCQGDMKGKFAENFQPENIETLSWMKKKLNIHVFATSLYIKCAFSSPELKAYKVSV